jgi:hypothetical protein
MRDVELMYKRQKIINLNRCLLILWNKGSRALLRAEVVNNDPIRIVLPEDANALGVGLAKISRPAIGLSASIDESGRAILVSFDFLDEGDGGVIEVLYQGSAALGPFLAGSIVGVPRGPRKVNTRGYNYDDTGNNEGEESRKSWARTLVPLALLLVLTVASTVVLGPRSQLTIGCFILFAASSCLTLIGALAGTLAEQFGARSLGFPAGLVTDSWQSPTGDRLVGEQQDNR